MDWGGLVSSVDCVVSLGVDYGNLLLRIPLRRLPTEFLQRLKILLHLSVTVYMLISFLLTFLSNKVDQFGVAYLRLLLVSACFDSPEEKKSYFYYSTLL